MKGKQIYFTKNEIENLCDFLNAFEEISPNEEVYAFWLKRIGSASYKIYEAKENIKEEDNGIYLGRVIKNVTPEEMHIFDSENLGKKNALVLGHNGKR